MTSVRPSPIAGPTFSKFTHDAFTRFFPHAPHLQQILAVPNDMNRYRHFAFPPNIVSNPNLCAGNSFDAGNTRYVDFTRSKIDDVIHKIHDDDLRIVIVFSPHRHHPVMNRLASRARHTRRQVYYITTSAEFFHITDFFPIFGRHFPWRDGRLISGGAPDRTRVAPPPCPRLSRTIQIQNSDALPTPVASDRRQQGLPPRSSTWSCCRHLLPHSIDGQPLGASVERRRHLTSPSASDAAAVTHRNPVPDFPPRGRYTARGAERPASLVSPRAFSSTRRNQS